MDSLFSLFLDNLLPVFLAAGAGFLLAAFTEIESRPISRVAFYIFSPCLIFNLLTENSLDGGAVLDMVAFTASQLLLVALIAWAAARLLGFSRHITVVIVLAALLPNAGNFGLSANLFAFGEPGLAQASLFFVTSGVLANTVGVYAASLGNADYKEALLGLLKIPTIYGVVLGLVFVRMNWELPTPIARATGVLGDAAIPTFLVLLGMLLRNVNLRASVRGLTLAVGIRLLASPALAIPLAAVFGLSGVARQAGVLEASMPAAVMTTVLATEFDVEPEFMTAVVFVSTILSPLTLTPILGYLSA